MACNICNGTGTIKIQKIKDGRIVLVDTPCPDKRC